MAERVVEHILLRRKEMRADPTWVSEASWVDRWGYHRFGLTMLHGTSISVTPVVLLPGQRTSPHDNPREHVVFLQEGEMAWKVPWPDGEYFRMDPEDVLYQPAGAMCQGYNEGPGPVRYLSISAYEGPDTPGAGFVAQMYSKVDIRYGDEATGEVVDTHKAGPAAERDPASIKPVLLRRRETRADPTWMESGASKQAQWPYHDFGLMMLRGTSISVTPINVLPGQRMSPHDNPREHIIYVQEGEMGWTIPWPDGEYFKMGPEDELFIPGGVMYQFFNDGPGPLRFLSLSAYPGPDTPGAGFAADVYSKIEVRVGDEQTGEVTGTVKGRQ
jgi:quercetin dioxygenase-like cupin family protein